VYPSLANFALIELLDGSLSEDFVAKMLLCKEFKNLIIIKSMSKDFGIAGIRVGYGIMSEDRVGALLENGYLWNTSGIGEYFLRLYARENFFAEYNELRKNYIHKTQAFFLALAQIEQIKVYPSLANFALIELLDGSLSEDFVAKMLIKYGIYMRTCRDKIGLNGEFVRIASRKFEENEIMIEAMKDCFKG
ncbi:aminotransferase class I/II-fold pyridoxal phosphate-dependent enzyme, partial [Campylobacter vulpis]